MSDMIPAVAKLLDLSGRTAIVTGASGGIGAGIARRFGEAGANVVCHYNANAKAAEAVVAAIESAGGKAFAVLADCAEFGKAEVPRTALEEVKILFVGRRIGIGAQPVDWQLNIRGRFGSSSQPSSASSANAA